MLIPATGFYEWLQREDGKQPYRFRRKDLEPFAFAGIWEFARIGKEEIVSACMIVGGKPSRFVHCEHIRSVSVSPGLAPIDIGKRLAGRVHHFIAARNLLYRPRRRKAAGPCSGMI
jgi:hypothetical protein